ncbi:MAG: hypothetical protein BWY56_00597 [Acidobacteria bacterium ADurb.Bin340]|nr:MAG: hypothetical protein BWY56_00597 [Acidobacteria bacterium ADurb.Bin340]HOD32858.1 hypothetical protein [Holophaga sp.]HQL48888.1 hypothetical protein [Holophaga sp.]
MTEATLDPKAPEVPKQTCQKCRLDYPLDHFGHGNADQACVCKRCLKAMGYRVP